MKKQIAAAVAAVALTIGGLALAAPASADDTTQTQEVASSPESTPDPSASPTSPGPSEASSTTSQPDTEASEPAGPQPESSDEANQPTEATTPTNSSESAKPTSDESGSTPFAPPGKGHDPVTICHKPGTPAQQTLTVDDNALKGHLGHGDTLGECAPLPTPVEGWWAMPDGGTADNVTWPQTAIAAGQVPCGVTAQVDTYPSQEALDVLAADGVLTQGEDYGIAQSWRFVYGGDCPPQPGPADPKATITVACGEAMVMVENPGENILTASVVVYVDGEFYQALAVSEGEHQSLTLDFPEDSGDHTVTVRTGPAFGDVELATATVESDCAAVVTPPTDTPTPSPAPSVPAPAVPAPEAAVLETAPVTEDALAQTGSAVNAGGPVMLAGLFIALGLIAFVGGAEARRRREAKQQ